MTSIDDVLEMYGNGITAEDFAGQLGDVMRRRVVADPRALSLHDRTVLTAVGVPAVDLNRPQGASHGINTGPHQVCRRWAHSIAVHSRPSTGCCIHHR